MPSARWSRWNLVGRQAIAVTLLVASGFMAETLVRAQPPAPNAKIEVTGKASREMLQPKQFVNCAVTIIAGREKFDVTIPPEAELVVRSANVRAALTRKAN